MSDSSPPRLITAYCLSYGHWTVIPHQLKASFEEMRNCGFNAVALSFSESEMRYSRRAFEIQVDLAHRCGLKVFVIPSRIGNRFAGAPLMPSLWLSQHPEAQLPDQDGFSGPIACTQNPLFRDWIKEFMGTLIGDFPLDGIIWDEPKHPVIDPKTSQRQAAEQLEDSLVEFLEDITAHCLALNPSLLITLFNEAYSSEHFTGKSTAIPGIHYVGYDGNLARQSFFHEEPQWMKYRVESVWQRTVNECRNANKKTFALVENMLMPKEAMAEYEENFEAYLQNYRPDHLAIYFYAHNNEDPEGVHAITRRLMRQYL